MEKMLIAALLGALLLAEVQSSLFCQHTAEPSSGDVYRSMVIQKKEREGQEDMYRITDSDNTDPAFNRSSDSFRLLTKMDSSECPGRGCVTELSAAIPKHQGSILYLTNVVGKIIPPGFNVVEVKNRLYCVLIDGDCGAVVPIYRFYKFTPAGLFHAYSTEDAEISGYTRETMPLCYAWQPEQPLHALEGSGQEIDDDGLTAEEREEVQNEDLEMKPLTCSKDSKAPPRAAMKALNVYKNSKTGAFIDHWYTTKTTGDDYKYEDTMGLVVTNQKKSNCSCLVRMIQMVDDKPEGIWARLDHKLVVDFKEPYNQATTPGEEYKSLPEEVFCVKDEGVCGATVALRKYFKLGDMDTIYTANDATNPMFGIPSPPGVLCYIWPASEKDKPKEAVKEESESDEVQEDEKEKTDFEMKKIEKSDKKKPDSKKSEAKKTNKASTSSTATPTTSRPLKKAKTEPKTAEKTSKSTSVKPTTAAASSTSAPTTTPEKVEKTEAPTTTTATPVKKSEKTTSKPEKKSVKTKPTKSTPTTTAAPEKKEEVKTTVAEEKSTSTAAPEKKFEEVATTVKADGKATSEAPESTTVAPKAPKKKTEKKATTSKTEEKSTSVASESSTVASESTTAAPESTTVATKKKTEKSSTPNSEEKSTSAAPEFTTAAPESTTAAPESSEKSSESSTASPTTSKTPEKKAKQ